eukprot:scaffold121934_cov66-Phaeocystis_antarctica.AAC.3
MQTTLSALMYARKTPELCTPRPPSQTPRMARDVDMHRPRHSGLDHHGIFHGSGSKRSRGLVLAVSRE